MVNCNLYGSVFVVCSILDRFYFFVVAYEITFNTIDNLIWKPQQTNMHRVGGRKKKADDGETIHWTMFWFAVFVSIYGNSFTSFLLSLLRFFYYICSILWFRVLHYPQKLFFFNDSRGCGASKGLVLISARGWGFVHYLSNKHSNNIKDLS